MIDIHLFFTEGPHDVGFLLRLLKDNGYEDYSDKPIDHIPDKDLKDLIFNSLLSFRYNEFKNLFVQKPSTPSILKKINQYILIYSTGGHIDKNVDMPDEDIFLNTLKNFESLKKSEIYSDKIRNISVALFYDADESLNDKIKKIKNYLVTVDVLKIVDHFDHKTIITLGPFKSFGCYIFKNGDSNEGCLEDILIPILSIKYEAAVKGSIQYLNKHYDEKLFKKKNYNHKKAMIGIVGQLEKSGVANASIISQGSFFKGNLDSTICKEIYTFIENLS